MLYWLAQTLDFAGVFNLIRYLSFRAGAAIATALVIGLVIGPKFIGWLRVRQGKGQPIRDDGPQTHLAKRGTPTMGGLMILTSMVASVLLWMDLSSIYVWACLFVTLGFGAIGFLDDYDKVTKASHKGLSGKMRLIFEFLIAGVAACTTPFQADVSRFQTQLPAPQGNTFAVVAEDPAMQGGLEFSQYAGYVAQEMSRLGYTQAASPETADLLVSFDYGVDNGRERVRTTPGVAAARALADREEMDAEAIARRAMKIAAMTGCGRFCLPRSCSCRRTSCSAS